MPHRERYLFVCVNRRDPDNPKGSCAQKGSEEVVKKLKDAVAKLGAHKTVRVCSCSCLDLCESGISIVEEPAHIAYGHVTLDDVDELARAFAEGKTVERLVVHRPKPA
jgi:(2Fe-2S) ferredoxin